MATAITPVKSTRVHPNSPTNAVQGALAAIDGTGNTFANTGREILVLTTDGNARTVIFKDINGVAQATVNLAASKTYVFGPFRTDRFGTTVTFTASNAAVTAGVFTLDQPGNVQVY